MVVMELKCTRCDHRFEAEAIDREDPNERYVEGARIRCPKCDWSMVEPIRTIRRLPRRAK